MIILPIFPVSVYEKCNVIEEYFSSMLRNHNEQHLFLKTSFSIAKYGKYR